MDDGWVCGNCHSINNARSQKCYSCHEPRELQTPVMTSDTAANGQPSSAGGTATVSADVAAAAATSNDSQMAPPASVVSLSPDAGVDQGPHFCASCGVRLPRAAEFCPSCGHRVREDSAELPTAPSASAGSGESGPKPSTVLGARRRVPRRALVLGALVVAGVAVVAVVATMGVPGSAHTLTGYLNLAQQQGTGYSNYTIPTGSDISCDGLGGYSDVRAGAQLVVKDEAGKVIGSGTLDQGQLSIDFLGAGAICAFPFKVTGLPKVEQYQLGMGNRGSITYSFADLETAKWDVTLTLGP